MASTTTTTTTTTIQEDYCPVGVGRGVGLLSLFDYKEHGVVDAIVPTKIRRGLPVRPITAVRQPPAGLGSPDLHFLRCPLPAPDGPCVLTRPLGEDGINNNNNPPSSSCIRDHNSPSAARPTGVDSKWGCVCCKNDLPPPRGEPAIMSTRPQTASPSSSPQTSVSHAPCSLHPTSPQPHTHLAPAVPLVAYA